MDVERRSRRVVEINVLRQIAEMILLYNKATQQPASRGLHKVTARTQVRTLADLYK